MSNHIIPFKNANFTIIEREGEPLFIAKEVCDFLGLSNPTVAIQSLKEKTQKIMLSQENCTKLNLGHFPGGLNILTEAGLYKLVFKSRKPEAEELGDWVAEIVLPTIRKTGKFDLVENQLQSIEDSIERELRLQILAYENVVKVKPNDIIAMLGLTAAKQELDSHLNKVRIEEVNIKIDELNTKVKKATVLREGDLSPEAVAKRYCVFSINDNPHPKFAECMARELGFYIKPEGNAGYQDDYVSVNFSDRNGVTVPLLKYSQKAIRFMDDYIQDNGLIVEDPPVLFSRGVKKGRYNYTYMKFVQHDIRIKINETTYKLHTQKK
ncbi:BRO-N domain-containing protein [Paenibacillus lautus]|uniref:BRO-N domain-containing protein n=1 Tax=Paenibacillus lautus TaxID=1401 RepID=UPI001C7CE605|nr:BRO family protein [Paenibacillus lautus]MBX4152224.1 hypothetical protein [Paenibacillus lautus]